MLQAAVAIACICDWSVLKFLINLFGNFSHRSNNLYFPYGPRHPVLTAQYASRRTAWELTRTAAHCHIIPGGPLEHKSTLMGGDTRKLPPACCHSPPQ